MEAYISLQTMCTQIKQYIVFHRSCTAVHYPPLIRLIAVGTNDLLHLAVVIFCCKICHFCRARDGEDDRGHWGAELTTGLRHLIHPNDLPCCPHRAFVIYLKPDTHNLQKCRGGQRSEDAAKLWRTFGGHVGPFWKDFLSKNILCFNFLEVHTIFWNVYIDCLFQVRYLYRLSSSPFDHLSWQRYNSFFILDDEGAQMNLARCLPLVMKA